MRSAILVVQVMLMCTATVCWGNTCSSDDDGGCGIDLNATNLDEAVELVMARVRLVLPEPDDGTSQDCDSDCLSNDVLDDTSSNASARIDQLIDNLNKLIKEMEEAAKVDVKEEKLRKEVDSFSKDRDWLRLKAILEEDLDPTDPALQQLKGNSWTDGKDALMEILYSGHVELLDKLLELGLDANVPWGTNNSTGLHAIASTGRVDIAELLFCRGALVDYRAEWNVTPLLRAAASFQPGMVRWLLDHHADIHAKDTSGWTALHFAARENDLETVKILVEAGVPVEALNDSNLTAKEEADNFGYQAVVDYLSSKEALNNSVSP